MASGPGLAALGTLRFDNQTTTHLLGISAGLPLSAKSVHSRWGGSLAKSVANDASSTSGHNIPARPIKTGLSSGTVPPATEQVPQSAPAADSHGRLANKTQSTSATVGKDRPSASAVPAGMDQVPPSLSPTDGSMSEGEGPSTSGREPQQAVMTDFSKDSKAGTMASANEGTSLGISRWQRFKWWLWGTPPQHWTYEDRTGASGRITETCEADSDAASSTATAANSTADSKARKRSKWFLGDMIGSAILRSGITKDEDVARHDLAELWPCCVSGHQSKLNMPYYCLGQSIPKARPRAGTCITN